MGGLNFRMLKWWGLESIAVGVKIVHVWGLNPSNENQMYDNQSWWNRFRSNYTYFNAFDMSEENLCKWALFWQIYKPDLVIGYTSALYEFATFLLRENKYNIIPKAVWSTSEPLFDFQKNVLEESFQAPVFSQYGINEVHHVAADCNCQEGLHINIDARIIEIADDKGNQVPAGESGNILVSDLENYAMPIIRYDTEDISALKQQRCHCGIVLPLMDYVKGRIYDVFILSNGKKIYGHRFTTFFYQYIDKIKKFQVHQTHIDRTVVKIVPQKDADIDSIIPLIERSFNNFTDQLIKFEIKTVSTIKNEQSGKFRFIKSDVKI